MSLRVMLMKVSVFKLQLALVATQASLTPELYWKSKLPTTPMPKAITDLLHSGEYITYIVVLA